MTASMTTTSGRTLKLKDLREMDETLFVRNEGPTALTCNSLDKSRPPFILGPKGSDDSVQVLPKAVANEPGFQRAWMRGIVTISDDANLENELILQAEQRVVNQAQAVAGLGATIEQPASARTMVPGKCLVSGETVFQTEKEVKEQVPPLAERFKDQTSEWIPTETMKDGQVVMVWTNPQRPELNKH